MIVISYSTLVFSLGRDGPQNFTVPKDVYRLKFDMAAGAGGNGHGSMNYGGNGGRMVSEYAVTPGQVIIINVGGMGAAADYGGKGGYNGGGNGYKAMGGGGTVHVTLIDLLVFLYFDFYSLTLSLSYQSLALCYTRRWLY